jgi:hypothetical protein
MLREVSFAFWIALGLAAGRSAAPTASATGETWTGGPDAASPGLSRLKWSVALLLGGLLLLSVPFRARQELATVDLARVSQGLLDEGIDPDGTRFRWTGPQVTILVNARASSIAVPMRSALPSGELQQVEVRVDGRPANRIAVGPQWQQVRTILPAQSSSEARRIDLSISPAWVPAETIPGSQDRRVHGLEIGEIRVVMVP